MCVALVLSFTPVLIPFAPRQAACTFQRILRTGCKHILDNNFQDHLKASPPNQAKSAKLWQASLNIYYGTDVDGTTQTINGVETVARFSYATGSGKGSISIDPQLFVINPLPNLFLAVNTKLYLPQEYEVDYNAMRVKVYYKTPDIGVSATGWHSDVLYNKTNIPTAYKNLQTPGTSVPLFTYGGQKDIFSPDHW